MGELMLKKIFSFFLIIIFLLPVQISAHAEDVSILLENLLPENIQEWIDGELAEQAGTSEWYIFALSQESEYDFSEYHENLLAYLENQEIYSASSRLKYALALAASGTDEPYITETLNTATGQQGIMSWVFGLHLLNNGFTCENFSTENVIQEILALQKEDGGWALMGTFGDVDVTAMCIQALAIHSEIPEVQTACERGITFLSGKQLENGGFQSYGVENPESTAQVIIALSALGMDAFSDERFIKNGNTLLQALNAFQLEDGTFSHTLDGTFNAMATSQVLDALVAYQRMQNQESAFFLLDRNFPENETIPETENFSPETEMEILSPEIEIFPEEETFPVTETATETETNFTEPITETTAISSVFSNFSSTTELIFSSSTVSEIVNNSEMSTFSETTTTTETTTENISPQKNFPLPEKSSPVFPKWKYFAFGGILFIGCGVGIILFFRKKFNRKNSLFVSGVMLTGVFVVYFVNISTPEEYYTPNALQKNSVSGTITLSIRCDTLIGKTETIPENGIILAPTEIPFTDGETAYDVLMQAAQAYEIQIEHEENYISAIDHLYEMQFGDLSGWLYQVNGEFSSLGCAEYVLQNGDCIEWLYTCEMGNDLS